MKVICIDGKLSPYIEDAFFIRHQVFSVEQGFDPEIDIDEYDDNAIHAILYESDRPIATARLLLFKEQGFAKIGRVAVLAEHRRKGLGAKIMCELIEQTRKNGLREVRLSSQLHAIPFYQDLGFQVQGEIYLEEGAEHQMMFYHV